MSHPAIHISDLRFAYPPPLPGMPSVAALDGIDLDVASGEFVAVMGLVGAGKSTLCLALNGAIPHAIDGDLSGQVVINGQDTRTASMRHLALQAGLVFENAQVQLFNASVADEVAFGLEAAGLPVDEIERRIGESLALVGLAGFEQRVPQTLSGGEQKRLALACVLALQPAIFILDEPTSGLDPRGRRQVLDIINRLRHEHDMTAIMATQDAETACLADRVVVLQQGRVVFDGTPTRLFQQVERAEMWGIHVPQMARLGYLLTQRTGETFEFVNLDDARQALSPLIACASDRATVPLYRHSTGCDLPYIEVENLSYRYPGAGSCALRDVDLNIGHGDWLALVGVNGSGKSTLLKHLNGLLRPTKGHVRVAGQDTCHRAIGELARTVSYLPQNPDRQIFSATVGDEVAYGPRQLGLRGAALDERVAQALDLLGLTSYAGHPPAVLGYGLRRQVALASMLAMDTPVLALDEPTVGLDAASIRALLKLIQERHRQGATVIMITHDLETVAHYANRVAILDEGRLGAQMPARAALGDIERLTGAGLDALPATLLARDLGIAPPLPLTADELADRLAVSFDRLEAEVRGVSHG